MMENEIWKDVVGYEGRYRVSNRGRIYSLITNKFLKFQKNSKGYYFVKLRKDGESKTSMVARLVAEAFIPNQENKPQCDHIDKDKTNNDVSNLRWVSSDENWEHGTQNGRRITPVQCIETGIVYKSIMEAERQTGIRNGNICMVCKGQRKTAGGYHWCYFQQEK